MTDSGGMQEETTYLDIPCLTVRNNTERPITVWQGSNTLIKIEEAIPQIEQIVLGNYKNGSIPLLWDGKTAGRVVKVIKEILA